MRREIVRIGCGAGFWGDSPQGPRQLVESGQIDYLVLDYLAEMTMSILARMRARNPNQGYATDFVDLVMKPLARDIAQRRIRVVSNAGGVNPGACRDALRAVFEDIGVDIRIAVVHGDDLALRANEYRAAGLREMFSGAVMPEHFESVNAYLGAFPIAAALSAGADIVITGRIADSALALGPLIHEFDWKASDYDLLSAGSLAGHVIECGTQATGGLFTDWRKVADGWDNMGFPIVDCAADGSFVVTKPNGTGGLVSAQTVAEQIVYEVADPKQYVLPDVIADWSQVSLEQASSDRVRVTGARGGPPTDSYKVSSTFADGYRASVSMMIAGPEAAERALAVAESILVRSERLMKEEGFDGFEDRSVEVLGSECNYGSHSRAGQAREVVLKIAVRHAAKQALHIFGREVFPSATSMAQSITGASGGRPEPQPIFRLFSFLAPKADVKALVELDGRTWTIPAQIPNAAAAVAADIPPDNEIPYRGALRSVPLIVLAHGRSGDKGDIANIGLLARRPEFLPWIRRGATSEAVRQYFDHFVRGGVERFEWPGLDGLNFVLHDALGGGGMASLRHDPQGKALAQILMDFPVEVPAEWVTEDGRLR